MVYLLQEFYESSPPFWDTTQKAKAPGTSPKTGTDARILARCRGLCLIAHSNNKSDGPFVVVAKADGPLAQTERLGAACGLAMELDGGRAACVGNDFQIEPADAVSPGTGSKGLGDRFFGSETGGEGFNATAAVAQLGPGVEAAQESLARGCGAVITRDSPANAFDLYDIDTSAQDHSLIGELAAEFGLHHVVILAGLRRAACARTGWRLLWMGGIIGIAKSIHLGDDIERAGLDVVVDAGEVLADDSQED